MEEERGRDAAAAVTAASYDGHCATTMKTESAEKRVEKYNLGSTFAVSRDARRQERRILSVLFWLRLIRELGDKTRRPADGHSIWAAGSHILRHSLRLHLTLHDARAEIGYNSIGNTLTT